MRRDLSRWEPKRLLVFFFLLLFLFFFLLGGARGLSRRISLEPSAVIKHLLLLGEQSALIQYVFLTS